MNPKSPERRFPKRRTAGFQRAEYSGICKDVSPAQLEQALARVRRSQNPQISPPQERRVTGPRHLVKATCWRRRLLYAILNLCGSGCSQVRNGQKTFTIKSAGVVLTWGPFYSVELYPEKRV